MKDITVLLSAAGSPTMPGQSRCFRSVKERKIRIVGVDMIHDPTILSMVDSYYQVPVATDPSYVDIILDICRREKVDIYFPNISAEVSAVSNRVNDFRRVGTIVSIANQDIVNIVNNKLKVYEYLKSNGIEVPSFYPIHTLQDFIEGCKKLGYPNKPVCIKMVSNSGARGVRIIDATKDRYEIFANEKPNSFYVSFEEMFGILQSAKQLDEMMLVAYMPGNEYTVDLLADKGKVLYIAGRENVVSLMSIAQKSVIKKIDSAYEMSSKIVELLQYSGNVGFDFMKDENGIPVLMDVNPRLTATVSVIAAAGINLPYLRVKQLLDEEMPTCRLDYGTTLVRRYGECFINSKGEIIAL